ncbi:putative ribonuclease H-like domain-containing protein [Tanacetum coccineum]|uniref:Ribonuclease H-like domain-containing protein n=1 Tax=Tanacetum coccineum TaxID=301880 RepID=A0ABQ5BJK3_9ASTR
MHDSKTFNNVFYALKEDLIYATEFKIQEMDPSAHRNMAPRAVLMKTGLRPLNTARPVNTAHPKTTVYSARPMSRFSKSAQSTVKRPYQIRITLTNKNFRQKFNTTKGSFYTARPKAVNTATTNSTIVNAVRENQGHPQKEDQGYFDSGCLRHMTMNISYLSDYKGIDEDMLPFGSEPKGEKNLVYELLKLNEDYLGKFDGKSDEGFFVGYSLNSKAFRVYNIRTRKVEESLHIRFLEDKPIIAGDRPMWLFDIDVLTKSKNYVPTIAGTNSNDFTGTEESIGAGHSSKETNLAKTTF